VHHGDNKLEHGLRIEAEVLDGKWQQLHQFCN